MGVQAKLIAGTVVASGLLALVVMKWQCVYRVEPRREIRSFCDPIAMGDTREAVQERFAAGGYRTLDLWKYPGGIGPWLAVSTPPELSTQNWYCIIGLEADRVVAVGYRTEDNHAWDTGGPPRGAPPDRVSEPKYQAK